MLMLENVHVRYGAIAALRGVSLRVNQGEMVGLIGVNGAGKTTTLMTIAGVLNPRRGPSPLRASPSSASRLRRLCARASRWSPKGGASSPA